MRTKEEIALALTKRKTPVALNESTWSDLVVGLNTLSTDDKAGLVNLIVTGSNKRLGVRMKQLLFDNAKTRAKSQVDIMLADDRLSITELDALI